MGILPGGVVALLGILRSLFGNTHGLLRPSFPQTIIETEEGKQYYAHGIGGVKFINADVGQNVPVIPINGCKYNSFS